MFGLESTGIVLCDGNKINEALKKTPKPNTNEVLVLRMADEI
jgi:hypothetical protein